MVTRYYVIENVKNVTKVFHQTLITTNNLDVRGSRW
jgi:hypothetical protein